MVELRAVFKTYVPRGRGRVIEALSDVSLQVAPGESVVVVGPGGAGKSTLLRLLTGEERASRGAVRVDGQDVARLGPAALARLRRRLGVLPQESRLIGDRTAHDNVAIVLRVLGAPRREARARALAALREAGLAGRAGARPAELAAGERRRLCLARALAGEPRLVLADEPTAGLDDTAGSEVVELLRALRTRSVTLVVATRAPGLAEALKGRVLCLQGGRLGGDA
jgi:cell division transport system ATP-binding protein